MVTDHDIGIVINGVYKGAFRIFQFEGMVGDMKPDAGHFGSF